MKSRTISAASLTLFTALTLSACGGGPEPDTIKPTLNLSGPATVTSTTPVTFTATASDASGIASVRFTRGNTLLGTDTTAPYEQAVTFSAADNGAQAITATATDTAGNSATVSRTVNVDIRTPDTTPPTVSVSGPSTVTSATPVTFTATASDASGVTKVEFFRGAALIGTDTTAPYTQPVTFSAADNGPQVITARATDQAGNRAEARHDVTVNITAPLPNITGTYVGTYTCDQGLTGLRLDLTSNEAGLVTGTFTFSAVASNPKVPTGSYTVEGTLNGLSLDLRGVTWITRPSGYLLANLSGQFNADRTAYTGTVSGPPNCTTFHVTKQ